MGLGGRAIGHEAVLLLFQCLMHLGCEVFHGGHLGKKIDFSCFEFLYGPFPCIHLDFQIHPHDSDALDSNEAKRLRYVLCCLESPKRMQSPNLMFKKTQFIRVIRSR